MFITLLAQAAPAPASPGAGLIGILPIVFMVVIMYYIMIRPQMRRQKEQTAMAAALKTGDHVVTASGIHGMISNVKDRTVMVKIADNVKIEMEKSAITNVVKAEA